MKTIVVTGGIAAGKSTACELFMQRVPEAVFFDCDEAVHDLLTKPGIKEKLRAGFGDAIFTPDDGVDRSRLGEIVFSDAAKRSLLESILHPEVLNQCLEARKTASDSGAAPLFLADVPLYYEVDFSFKVDEVVVVAASRETRLRRLRERASITFERAERLLDIQMPQEEKMARADRVLWNEGSISGLRKQVHYVATLAIENYGQ